MAKFALCHPLYNAVDRIVYVAGENVTRHHLRDRQLQNGNPTFRNSAYDVALRQNSGETPAGAQDHQRADTMLGEQLGRGSKVGSKIDAHDLATFCGKNGLYGHARLR
jgi:hypothetical protein